MDVLDCVYTVQTTQEHIYYGAVNNGDHRFLNCDLFMTLQGLKNQ
jgi:hypothetical protein